MISVAHQKVMPESPMEFPDMEIGGFLHGSCRILNFPTSRTGCAPISSISEGDQRVAFSYIRDSGKSMGRSVRQRKELWLIRRLLRFVETSQEPVLEKPDTTNEIRIKSGSLGKPRLCVGGDEGPSVSFAHSSDATWAALCWTGGTVGIDVASKDEFPHDYPLHRAFHGEEFSEALKITGRKISEAAALLWTAKEAVVKCIGTGFHLIDPLELSIVATGGRSEKYHYKVCFDDKVLKRLPELGESFIGILASMKEGVGLSVAVMLKNSSADSYDTRGLRNLCRLRRRADADS